MLVVVIAVLALLVVVMTIAVVDRRRHENALLVLRTEHERVLAAHHDLAHIATHDAMTGLLNRGGFMTRLEQTLEAAASTPPRPIAVLFMGERLNATKVVCALVAVGGVVGAVLSAPSSSSPGDTALGYVWAVVSLFAWTTYLLASKLVRRSVETTRLMMCSTLIGSVTVSIIVPFVHADVGMVTGTTWVWISLLALVPGLLGHGLFAWAQPRVDASVSSVLIQGEPVLASVSAWLMLGQRVSVLQMTSMGVVVGALAVLAWRESREPTALDRKSTRLNSSH